jgi:hypothetical protein
MEEPAPLPAEPAPDADAPVIVTQIPGTEAPMARDLEPPAVVEPPEAPVIVAQTAPAAEGEAAVEGLPAGSDVDGSWAEAEIAATHAAEAIPGREEPEMAEVTSELAPNAIDFRAATLLEPEPEPDVETEASAAPVVTEAREPARSDEELDYMQAQIVPALQPVPRPADSVPDVVPLVRAKPDSGESAFVAPPTPPLLKVKPQTARVDSADTGDPAHAARVIAAPEHTEAVGNTLPISLDTARATAPVPEPAAAAARSSPAARLDVVFETNSSFTSDKAVADIAEFMHRFAGEGVVMELRGTVGGDVKDASPQETERYNRWMADRRMGRVSELVHQLTGGAPISVMTSYIENDDTRRVVIVVRGAS